MERKKYARYPYKVFIETICNEIKITKQFVLMAERKEDHKILDASLSKLIGFCELIQNSKEEFGFEKKYFKRMEEIVAWKLQELIDICPTNKKNSEELFLKLQSMLCSWLNGNIGKWEMGDGFYLNF